MNRKERDQAKLGKNVYLHAPKVGKLSQLHNEFIQIYKIRRKESDRKVAEDLRGYWNDHCGKMCSAQLAI